MPDICLYFLIVVRYTKNTIKINTKGETMDNVESFVRGLESLFNLDLLNKTQRINNSVIIIMEDGTKIRVVVDQLA